MNMTRHFFSMIFLLSMGCAPADHFVSLENSDAIVGGEITTLKSPVAKYVVLVIDDDSGSYCTGTLIRANVVLTAAHCLGKRGDGLTLAFGRNPMSGNYIARRSAAVVVHPDYKKANSQDPHDLALILIDGSAPHSFAPAKIPDNSFPMQKNLGFTAIGYGRISGKSPQGIGVLRDTQLKVSHLTQSQKQFYVNQENGKGICNGDSGGPALMRYKGADYIVGVASAIYWTIPSSVRADQRADYISKKDTCAEKSIYINLKSHQTWLSQALLQLLN